MYLCMLQDLSYRDRHWHDKCFKCSSCATSLVNESFAFKNDQLYCAACYELMFAPRCTRCKQVFRAGLSSSQLLFFLGRIASHPDEDCCVAINDSIAWCVSVCLTRLRCAKPLHGPRPSLGWRLLWLQGHFIRRVGFDSSRIRCGLRQITLATFLISGGT